MCKTCKTTTTPLVNTIFDGKHIEITDILSLMVFWLNKTTNKDTQNEINSLRKDSGLKLLSNATVVKYFKLFRQVVQTYLSNNMTMVGGKNKSIKMELNLIN